MKDVRPLKYFIGIEIAQNPSGLYLSQRKHASEIIVKTKLTGAKPASTPLEPNHQLAMSIAPLFDQPDRLGS